MGLRPWMNASDGPAVALAKVGASADSAENMKDTTRANPWRLHVATGGTGRCVPLHISITLSDTGPNGRSDGNKIQ